MSTRSCIMRWRPCPCQSNGPKPTTSPVSPLLNIPGRPHRRWLTDTESPILLHRSESGSSGHLESMLCPPRWRAVEDLMAKPSRNPANARDSAALPLTAESKLAQFSASRGDSILIQKPHDEGVLPDMNKNELIGAVADASGLSRSDATKAVEGVFDTITGALSKGDEVRLVGFGTFSVAKRKASTGRN